MKKKIILFFIISTFITSIISVKAYSYLAKDIKYIRKDGTESNVEEALNELQSSNSFDRYPDRIIEKHDNYTFEENFSKCFFYGGRSNNGNILRLNGVDIKPDDAYWYDSGEVYLMSKIFKDIKKGDTLEYISSGAFLCWK